MSRRARSPDLKRRLDAVENDAREEYPEAHLITVLSADCIGEPDVEDQEDLITCDGEIYRMAKHVRDTLAAQGEH